MFFHKLIKLIELCGNEDVSHCADSHFLWRREFGRNAEMYRLTMAVILDHKK